MTVLELSFPTGRYHATPWGRHVNEGAIEWPPSPWRILRALVATWHLKAKSEIKESVMRSLVEKLSALPRFQLPPATTSHTRHYMPYNEGKNEKTTKVFDTFIQIEEGSTVLVIWDGDLPANETAALKILADRLGYFGRAESLVVARVPEDITDIEYNSIPHAEDKLLPLKTELIRTLVPVAPLTYATWREDFLAKALASLGAKPTAAQKKKLPQIPEHLFSALHADTGDLQIAGWNLPPGAQFVNYTRREDAFAPAKRPRPKRNGKLPTVARYSIASTVAPSILDAVSISARTHNWICKLSDGQPAVVFTGKNENDVPRTDHQHAHIFCEANGPRDSVTHISIWAPMGFDEEACLALRKLNRVWGTGGHDIRLVLHAIGQPEEFKDCALLGASKVWRSYTPFVSTRHAKTFRDGRPKMDPSGWQVGSAAHDLLRLLGLNPKWQGARIRKQLDERDRPFIFGSDSSARRFRSLQFQTTRHDGNGRRGHDTGAGFIIEFPQPVSGPLALGYGAHFGLGLFVPVDGMSG